MGAMSRKVTMFFENRVGPFDWYEDDSAGFKAFKGRFLIYDRAGKIQDFVLGQIALRNQRTAEVYLYDPPLYIGKHRHGRCMQLLTPGGKWFRLHFEKPASTFGDAYTFVEHMLTEAFNLTH